MKVLAALILLYCVLTGLLIARVPLGKAPDEMPHILYVEHLAERGSLPVFQPQSALQNPGYEFHQPPLYYALCAPGWKLLGAGAQDYWCRVVSLICGAATLWFLWYSLALLFPQRRDLQIYATGFAALWPLHQAAGASAGNDALAGLIAAAIFHRIALASRQNWNMRHAILLGALVGLALLTKSTGLVLGIIAIGAAWHLSRQSAVGNKHIQPVFVAGVALVIGGWWLVRNQMLYGDPFALQVFNQAFGNDPSAQLVLALKFGAVSPLVYFEALFYSLLCTTWGIFGGPETARQMYNAFSGRTNPQAWPALWLLLPCVLAMLGAFVGNVRALRSWKSWDEATRRALVWWMAGAALVALAWLQFNNTYFQAQARYFHPALLPLCLVFVGGWMKVLAGRARSIFAVVFAVLLIVITLWNALVWRTLV